MARQVAWSMPARTPATSAAAMAPAGPGFRGDPLGDAGAQLRQRPGRSRRLARQPLGRPMANPTAPRRSNQACRAKSNAPGSAGPSGRCNRARHGSGRPGSGRQAPRRLTRSSPASPRMPRPGSPDRAARARRSAEVPGRRPAPRLRRPRPCKIGAATLFSRTWAKPKPGQANATASRSASPTLEAPRHDRAANSAQGDRPGGQPTGPERRLARQGEQQGDPGPQCDGQPQEPATALLLQHGAQAGRGPAMHQRRPAAADPPAAPRPCCTPLPQLCYSTPPSNTRTRLFFSHECSR